MLFGTDITKETFFWCWPSGGVSYRTILGKKSKIAFLKAHPDGKMKKMRNLKNGELGNL